MGTLRNSQTISKLVGAKHLTAITLLMYNLMANFIRILGICKDFVGNRVNEPAVIYSKCSLSLKVYHH